MRITKERRLMGKVRVLDNVVNNFDMWIACSIMVIAVVGQSVVFFRAGLKRARELGIPKEKLVQGCRSAAITAVGPTFSSCIALLALVAVIGGPSAWMRLNDIGAARTEIAVASMVQSVIPAGSTPTVKLAYTQWAMGLNNMGWMIVALLLTPSMGSVLKKMNSTFNPVGVKMVMHGATLGLFAYLLANGTINKPLPFWWAAAGAVAAMVLILRIFAKKQRMLELSLGIAMVVGMTIGAVFYYMAL